MLYFFRYIKTVPLDPVGCLEKLGADAVELEEALERTDGCVDLLVSVATQTTTQPRHEPVKLRGVHLSTKAASKKKKRN